MPRLNRVRLVGVGHQHTFVHDRVLDFTDGTRAAHSVNWLENGGGKTTLLSLIFATLLPQRRFFLNPKGRLENLLPPGRAAQVVLEFQLAGGPCLVGTFYQASADRGDAQRLFFRTRTPHLTLENLPVQHEVGGRLRVAQLADFRDRLAALLRRGEDVYYTTGQEAWQSELDKLGLFRQLLAFQVMMSRTEGNVENGLKFSNTRELVDLLTDVLVDPGALEAFSRGLDSLRAEKRAYHDQYEPLAGFATALLPPLRELQACGQNVEEARIQKSFLAGQALTLERALAVKAGEERARAEDLGAGADRLDREAREWEGEAGRLDLAVHQVTYQLRARELTRLEDQAGKVRERHQAATREEYLASVLGKGRELGALRERVEATREQLEAREREQHPRREALTEARTALASALLHHAAQADVRRENLRRQRDEQRAVYDAAREAARKAMQDLADKRTALDQARIRAAKAADARGSPEREQLLLPGEHPVAAAARSKAQVQAAERAASETKRTLAAATAAVLEAGEALGGARLAAQEAQNALKRAEQRLNDLHESAGRLRGHSLFQALYPHGAELDADVLDRLAAHAHDLREDAVRARQEVGRLRQLDEALEGHDLLPPAPDVLRAQHEYGLHAFTGYQAWASLQPNRAPVPELARMIVARGGEDIVAATSRLTPTQLPSEAVRIVREADLLDWPDLPGTVVPAAHAAHTDPEAARTYHAEVREQLQAARAAEGHAEAGEAELATLRTELQQHLTRFPDLTRVEEAVRAAHTDAERAEAARQGAAEALAGRERQREEAERAEGLCQDAERQARERQAALVSRLAYLDDDGAGEALATLPAAIAHGEELSTRASADVDAAQSRVEGLTTQMNSATDTAKRLRDEAQGLDPDARPTEGDEGSLRAAVQALEAALHDSDLQQLGARYEDDRKAHAEGDAHLTERLRRAGFTRPELDEYVREHHHEDPGLLHDSTREAARALQTEISLLEKGAAELRGTLEQMARSHGLHVQDMPTGAIAEDRLPALRREAVQAREGQARAGEAARAHRVEAEAARTVASELEEARRPLAEIEASDPVPLELEGDLRAQARQILDAHRMAARTENRAEKAYAEAVERWRHAISLQNDPRLLDPEVHELRNLDAQQLLRVATAKVESLERFLVVASAMKEQLAATARLHADTGTTVARSFIGSLHALSRASRIPEQVPHLGTHEFLRLHANPGHDDLGALARQLALELADEKGSLTDGDVFRRFLHRLYTFEASMLFPNNAYRKREYLSIEAFQARSSGGEGVVATLLLYCAIARARTDRAGTLITGGDLLMLDNPFAKVTAEHLLRPIFAMADACDVQFVAWTAIKDLGVLRLFPRVNRLRKNQVDGRGRVLVNVEQASADTLFDERTAAHLDAVSIARRSAAS